ncbi:CPBP family intramembrane glutamic endopeptidase [Enterococcus gilvus]|uniref:CPBP family intramembrane glutamic endopeptidase n=1 Tax=Enterococcus gilvus TaxID=160453 RepID=UPI0028D162B5|nr:CPBP family intramembrane glutamic endopeptidase [Enterococcus gilvus]
MFIEKETTTYNQKGLEDFLMYTPIFIVILFTVISAPIMEEILFRGFILKVCFVNHMLIGIIVSGFLFGIAHHPTNLGSFFTYAGTGVALGIYYKKHQRIELSILLHFLTI